MRSDQRDRRFSSVIVTACSRMWALIFTALFPSVILSYELNANKLEGLAKARVESILNVHLFSHNLVMKHIPGADPELVLLSHYYEELDRIPLSEMSRIEINKLLAKLGFHKKEHPEAEVPEEFRFAPAKDSPFEGHQSAPQINIAEEHQSEVDSQHPDL